MNFVIVAVAATAWYGFALYFVRTYPFKGDEDFLTGILYRCEVDPTATGGMARKSLDGRFFVWLVSPFALPLLYLPWWAWRAFRFTFGA